MASIQKIKSPLTGEISYRVQVRVKGRPSESETFTNKKDAIAWAAGIESAIEDGRHFPHRKSRRTTFAALVDRYRESVLPEVSNGPARETHLQWWLQRFHACTIGGVKADKIAEGRDAIIAETVSRGEDRTERYGNVVPPHQYQRSGSAVKRSLATRSHLFTMGVEESRLVDRNPCREVTTRKEPRGRIRVLPHGQRDPAVEAEG